jgi:hypothetical protein
MVVSMDLMALTGKSFLLIVDLFNPFDVLRDLSISS